MAKREPPLLRGEAAAEAIAQLFTERLASIATLQPEGGAIANRYMVAHGLQRGFSDFNRLVDNDPLSAGDIPAQVAMLFNRVGAREGEDSPLELKLLDWSAALPTSA